MADEEVDVARLVDDARRYLRLRRWLGNAFLLLGLVFALVAWVWSDWQHLFAAMAIGAAVGGLRLRTSDKRHDRARQVVDELGE